MTIIALGVAIVLLALLAWGMYDLGYQDGYAAPSGRHFARQRELDDRHAARLDT